jgi:hypothetical protein
VDLWCRNNWEEIVEQFGEVLAARNLLEAMWRKEYRASGIAPDDDVFLRIAELDGVDRYIEIARSRDWLMIPVSDMTPMEVIELAEEDDEEGDGRGREDREDREEGGIQVQVDGLYTDPPPYDLAPLLQNLEDFNHSMSGDDEGDDEGGDDDGVYVDERVADSGGAVWKDTYALVHAEDSRVARSIEWADHMDSRREFAERIHTAQRYELSYAVLSPVAYRMEEWHGPDGEAHYAELSLWRHPDGRILKLDENRQWVFMPDLGATHMDEGTDNTGRSEHSEDK